MHDSRGIEIVNFTISLALSASTLMASAGTPYRLVPAHFYPWSNVLLLHITVLNLRTVTNELVIPIVIPLHFLCTHFWHLVHCNELLPSPLLQTPHGHLTAFCLTFWRFPFIITLVLFILTLMPLLSTSGVLGSIRGYTPYTNLRVFLTAYTHLSYHK